MDRQRKTGSVQPNKIGGYKPRAITGDQRAWLLARIKEGDFTLRGLVAELAERGLKVDYRSVWTFVHDQKLSFKKAWRLANATDLTWRAGGRSGSNTWTELTPSAWCHR